MQLTLTHGLRRRILFLLLLQLKPWSSTRHRAAPSEAPFIMENLRTLQTCALRTLAGLMVTIGLVQPATAAPFAYIANLNSDAVSVIDVATSVVVATVPVGRAPYGVAVNASGSSVYVLNTLDDTVSVIDVASRSVMAIVPVGELGGHAAGLAINRQGTRVYVANAQENTLSVIDTSTNSVAGPSIAVGSNPLGVAVSPSGSYVYVTNTGSSSLSIVDTSTNVQIAELPVGSAPRGLAVHPSGNPVYVATREGLAIVDLSTMTVVAAVPIAGACAVGSSPDGMNVYVTSDDGNALVVIDAQTYLTVGPPIDLGSHPCGVSVTADGRFIHVANGGSDSVSVIDSRMRSIVDTVSVLSDPSALGSFISDVPPVANAQSLSMLPDAPMAIALTATDVENDPLTFNVVEGPKHGTLTGTPPNLVYTPAPDYAGLDSIAFTANDGAVDSSVATISITVPFSTSTEVTSSLNPSTFGQAVILTATVTSKGDTPTGSVEFFDGSSSLGTVALDNGAAALTISTIGAGSRSITAVYAHTRNLASSTSRPLTQTVSRAATRSSITISPYTAAYSDIVKFTASITPDSVAGQAPATTVAFRLGTQTVGTARLTMVGGVYRATWTGALTESTSYGSSSVGQVKPGAHTVVATFLDANPNFTVSNATRPTTIYKEDARVAYTGPASLSLGQNGTVPLTVTVKDITAAIGDPEWDANPGDIRNAQVWFIDRATNTILGTANVTADGDRTVGTATYNWAVNLGTAQARTYTIGFIIGNYYYRNSDGENAVVKVSKQ